MSTTKPILDTASSTSTIYIKNLSEITVENVQFKRTINFIKDWINARNNLVKALSLQDQASSSKLIKHLANNKSINLTQVIKDLNAELVNENSGINKRFKEHLAGALDNVVTIYGNDIKDSIDALKKQYNIESVKGVSIPTQDKVSLVGDKDEYTLKSFDLLMVGTKNENRVSAVQSAAQQAMVAALQAQARAQQSASMYNPNYSVPVHGASLHLPFVA